MGIGIGKAIRSALGILYGIVFENMGISISISMESGKVIGVPLAKD